MDVSHHKLPTYSLGDINYFTDYTNLENMYFELKNNEYVASSTVDSWYYSFRVWMNETTNPDALALLGPGQLHAGD